MLSPACCGRQVEESWSTTGNSNAVFYPESTVCSFGLIAIKDGLGPSYSHSCRLKSLDLIRPAHIILQFIKYRLVLSAAATLESPILRRRILLSNLT